MAYNIQYDSKVFKQLSKVDKKDPKEIFDKIEHFTLEPMLIFKVAHRKNVYDT